MLWDEGGLQILSLEKKCDTCAKLSQSACVPFMLMVSILLISCLVMGSLPDHETIVIPQPEDAEDPCNPCGLFNTE